MRSLNPSARNTSKARRMRRALLRFNRSGGRLAGMPVLALMYPSPTLADLGNQLGAPADATAQQVVEAVSQRLQPLLRKVTAGAPSAGPEDERWYWAAPILLDRARGRGGQWWSRDELARHWSPEANEEDADGAQSDEGWEDHVAEARKVLAGWRPDGKPPGDLAEVLAKMVLAGPATCGLRALCRVATGAASSDNVAVMDAAAAIGGAFRSLFNRPEAMAIIRSTTGKTPYWQAVLDYGLAGGLTAVVDEYAHVLRDAQGLFDASLEEKAARLSEAMAEALTLRTSRQQTARVGSTAEGGVAFHAEQLRTHFALRFGQQTSKDETAVRSEQVRTAFNSPFWPFVLASTSVGQEGLDFHSYCHAVVHWNLPSNPVDMEQREGRVHRYKNHAVRKNVARAHGSQALRQSGGDPWELLFEIARRDNAAANHGGLVPHWIFPQPGGAAIERHVPALPLSRDIARLEALRHSLAVYRMVFGQPRQDDLLAYLVEQVPAEVLEEVADLLEIDLRPRWPITKSDKKHKISVRAKDEEVLEEV